MTVKQSERGWYTVPETAARLGLSATIVYALLRSRKLAHRKVGLNGGRYQITEAHIRAYLESCEVTVQPEGSPRAITLGMSPERRRLMEILNSD